MFPHYGMCWEDEKCSDTQVATGIPVTNIHELLFFSFSAYLKYVDNFKSIARMCFPMCMLKVALNHFEVVIAGVKGLQHAV